MMKSRIRHCRAGLLAMFAIASVGPAHASGENAPAPSVDPGSAIWLVPTAAEVFPQSDAEKTANQANGRALPTPELLQPDLDPALAAYVPTAGLTINQRFTVGASDILPGLVERWEAAFRKYHPGFSLQIARPMAGSLGALELIKGNLDFVFVSRELKPTDISGFREKFGYDPLSVPIAGGTWRHYGFLDALAIMVHQDNPISQLTFAQLDAIYSTTLHRGGKEVRTWGDVGVEGAWAKRPIHRYGIKPWNGFEEFMRQRVLSTGGNRGEWRGDIHYDATFFPLARRVAADPAAIGYTGLSALDSRVKIVPVVESDGGPAFSPTYEYVASARYPLSRLIYLNANSKPGKFDPALNEFLRFILSREGQAVIRDQKVFLPLRAHQVENARSLFGQ